MRQFKQQYHLEASTGLSPDEIAQMRYREGIAYLKFQFSEDEIMRAKMERCTTFWNWWCNQWNARDEWFLKAQFESKQKAQSLYQIANAAHTLLNHPADSPLQKSYAHFIHRIIKQETT